MTRRTITVRERWMLAAAVLTVLTVGLWLGILEPYQRATTRLDRKIVKNQEKLDQLQQLARRYGQLKQSVVAAERRMKAQPGRFSLFARVEEVAQEMGIRDNLASLRPQQVPAQGEFQEESLEVRLEKVPLDDLIRFLVSLKNSGASVHIKRLRIKTRFDDRSLLDTTVILSHFREVS